MKKILFSLSVLTLLALINGCTVDKNIQERLAKIEARLDAIEKLIMPPKEEAQKEAYNIPVGNSHVYSAAGANNEPKEHIVIFSNFQCPYCAHADESIRQLLKNPKFKDKVDVVFKNFPFERHPMARSAAKAALAIGEQGNDKYWEMVKILFENQGKGAKWNEMSEEKFHAWLLKIAAQLKLDVGQFQKDLKTNNEKYDNQINEEMKQGTELAKLQGTPWILVNGWLLQGEINEANINNLLERGKAEKK